MMAGNHMFQFTLSHNTHVMARLFDLRGRTVAVIMNEARGAGLNRLAIPNVGRGTYILDFGQLSPGGG